MIDFVLIPKQKAIAEEAKSLGFSKLIFCQYYKENLNTNNIDAAIISTNSPRELNKLIEKIGKKKKVIVEGNNDAVNTAALKNRKVFALLSPEKKTPHNGLNQVLCKLARAHNILIIINFQELREKANKEKALLIEKISKNIQLCRKYKAKIILATMARNKDELINQENLNSLALSLGFSTQQLKNIKNF